MLKWKQLRIKEDIWSVRCVDYKKAHTHTAKNLFIGSKWVMRRMYMCTHIMFVTSQESDKEKTTGGKDKHVSLVGFEPITSQTPAGWSIHWAMESLLVSKTILLLRFVLLTCILKAARISNVVSVLYGDKWRLMVNFKLRKGWNEKDAILLMFIMLQAWENMKILQFVTSKCKRHVHQTVTGIQEILTCDGNDLDISIKEYFTTPCQKV